MRPLEIGDTVAIPGVVTNVTGVGADRVLVVKVDMGDGVRRGLTVMEDKLVRPIADEVKILRGVLNGYILDEDKTDGERLLAQKIRDTVNEILEPT